MEAVAGTEKGTVREAISSGGEGVILKGQMFVAGSGRSKVHGRMDWVKLIPETPEEAGKLKERQEHRRPIAHHGSEDWSRALEELRNVGRAIDPHLKEDIRKIPS